MCSCLKFQRDLKSENKGCINLPILISYTFTLLKNHLSSLYWLHSLTAVTKWTDSWCLGGGKSPWNKTLPRLNGENNKRRHGLESASDINDGFIQNLELCSPEKKIPQQTSDNGPSRLMLELSRFPIRKFSCPFGTKTRQKRGTWIFIN